ncbi:MAG TPA: L-2-amino-thiazoline-4-carboxylic acid hydrolase [Dehalococcoidia bacterium]|nr:L-2-amino-thiazoline-4-carboxylic acid hydrolase [Dehalococcoidia bacterium]
MEEAVKRFAPMMKLMLVMQGALSKAFYERYGKEALTIIAEVASRGGVKRAEIMRKMMPVIGMKAIGEQFKMMGSMLEMGMEIIELSDEVFHFKVSRCPLGIEGTSRELCEAMMTSDAKMLDTLLGQEVETKILQSVAAGDERCEVIFSKK